MRELDRPIPAPPRYRTFRDHTAPVERILLVSCIPDHLGADEIELWLHDADHLGYKGLKIFDHGRSDPNSTSAAHGQGKQLFLIFGTPDEALTARGYWARKYVSMGGAQVRLDCQWLGQYRHDHPSIGAFTQNLGTPPGLLLSCCRSSDRSSPKALPSALNWSRTNLVPAATGLLWLPATRSSSSFRRSRMATVLPRNRSSQSGMSLQGSCLRPLMQSTASGRSNTAQPANDDAAEASEEEAEADDPESEDGDSSDAEGHNEEAAPAAAGCRRSRTRRPSNFASSYREEAVAGVPDWCEENLCGPACIDEAKGEGKIAELKQNVPEGQDPLQFISLRQWVLTDYRKSFDSSPASQRQPHLLSGSGAEVIAPCVAASSTLLRPNFADSASAGPTSTLTSGASTRSRAPLFSSSATPGRQGYTFTAAAASTVNWSPSRSLPCPPLTAPCRHMPGSSQTSVTKPDVSPNQLLVRRCTTGVIGGPHVKIWFHRT